MSSESAAASRAESFAPRQQSFGAPPAAEPAPYASRGGERNDTTASAIAFGWSSGFVQGEPNPSAPNPSAPNSPAASRAGTPFEPQRFESEPVAAPSFGVGESPDRSFSQIPPQEPHGSYRAGGSHPAPSEGFGFGAPADAPGEAADAQERFVDLNLRAILTGVPDQVLGFSAGQVPTAITTQLPLGMIKAQLAGGCVKATVDQIMRGCDPAYQPAFARAHLEYEVVLPLQEIFHSLPEDPVGEDREAGDRHPEGGAGGPATFTEVAREDFLSVSTGVLRSFGDQEERTFSTLFASGSDAEAVNGGEPEPLESLEVAEGASTRPFAGESAAASSDGLSSADLAIEPARPTGFAHRGGAEPPVNPEGALERDEPAAGFMAAETGQAQQAEQARAAGRASARANFEFGFEDQNSAVLNSILMTDEELSLQRVAELASELPGIGACVVLSADGKLLGGNLPMNVEARIFVSMAPRLYRIFHELSAEMGLGNTEVLTIHTDRGTVSFFKGLSSCLSVLHSRRDFVPGVRDKLISIANELKQF